MPPLSQSLIVSISLGSVSARAQPQQEGVLFLEMKHCRASGPFLDRSHFQTCCTLSSQVSALSRVLLSRAPSVAAHPTSLFPSLRLSRWRLYLSGISSQAGHATKETEVKDGGTGPELFIM